MAARVCQATAAKTYTDDPALQRRREKQRLSALQPKCACGNALSRQRQMEGVDHCPACDPPDPLDDAESQSSGHGVGSQLKC